MAHHTVILRLLNLDQDGLECSVNRAVQYNLGYSIMQRVQSSDKKALFMVKHEMSLNVLAFQTNASQQATTTSMKVLTFPSFTMIILVLLCLLKFVIYTNHLVL
jgi:hypothetical protein